MGLKLNFLRSYKLLRHSLINLFQKKKKFHDDLMANLDKKGYYEFNINDLDFDNLSSIVINKVEKYSSETKGDTRLYGIDNESQIIKENFHKIINQEKERIKSVSTIKNLYLHCTMGGYLKNDTKASSGGGWHRDHHFELFKLMIYLSDVNLDNGPFCYLEKSHTKFNQFLSLFFFKLLSLHQTRYSEKLVKLQKFIFRYKQRTFTGKKGSCIVFNSSGLHRGLEIKEGTRIALTAYIYPFTDNQNILYERSKHMNIPKILQKNKIQDYLRL